eukprot:SAG22_NODE_349_length_11854_cov_8.087282_3_plen_120_part_00
MSRKSADDHVRFDNLLRELKKSQSGTPPRATTPPTGRHPKASDAAPEALEDAEIDSINRLLGSARKLDRESPEPTPQIPELPHDTLRSPVSEFGEEEESTLVPPAVHTTNRETFCGRSG